MPLFAVARLTILYVVAWASKRKIVNNVVGTFGLDTPFS